MKRRKSRKTKKKKTGSQIKKRRNPREPGESNDQFLRRLQREVEKFPGDKMIFLEYIRQKTYRGLDLTPEEQRRRDELLSEEEPRARFKKNPTDYLRKRLCPQHAAEWATWKRRNPDQKFSQEQNIESQLDSHLHNLCLEENLLIGEWLQDLK